MPVKIFASYSRVDKDFVVPITQVLRLTAEVFRDEDSIAPGTLWANELAKSLDECDILLVFWTLAASESKYVEIEYTQVIASGKSVVPIILDETALPEALAKYQWIDFRPYVRSAADHAIQLATGAAIGMVISPLAIFSLPAMLGAYLAARFSSKNKLLSFSDEDAEGMRLLFTKYLESNGAGRVE